MNQPNSGREIMKNVYATAFLALVVAANAAFAQTQVDERRPASRDGTVKITNPAGSVHVIGWDRDSVAITGTLTSEIERLNVGGDQRATKIRVVPLKNYRAQPLEGSDLIVRVPNGSHVAVRASGDIEAEDIRAGVDLESTDGNIRIRGFFRAVYAQTAAGDIDIDASRKSMLRAHSVGGDVTVRGAGGYIEVSTVSGNALVEGQRVWEGRVTSVSGDILFRGTFERDGSFQFESNSGTIELILPPDAAANFDITSFSGQLESEFPADTSEVVDGSRREYIFNIGGRGAQIKVKTFKGKVRLRKGE